MIRNSLKLCIILLILLTSSTISIAQGVRYLTKTVDITIPTVLDLQITSGATPNFNFNTTSKLDNGMEVLNATILTYRSNMAWFVTVQAGSSTFSGGDGTLPASIIGFRKNGDVSYTPLSNSAISLSGATGSKNIRGTSTIGVDYKLTPGYLYAPATDYSIGITYTISNL